MTPAEPDLIVDTPAQHRALGHPMRHRLLNSLRGGPATTSQLARRLQVHKGSVAHHLSVLVGAGMVRPSEERQVRGGTEKYYEVAHGSVTATGDLESVSALFAAITPELAADDAALLHLRHLQLSEAQAQQLRTALDAIVTEPSGSDGDQPTFGVLVGMYRCGSARPRRAH
ncbi:MAG: ArsR/SmtB family transcription factor [Janthinobacterium lividum]